MAARLTAAFRVAALVRRVHDAGGSAMVLAKGDADTGAVLILTLDRGIDPAFLERGPDGILAATGPTSCDSNGADDYWRRRRRNDPDLWVVEVDVADAERFAAETIATD